MLQVLVSSDPAFTSHKSVKTIEFIISQKAMLETIPNFLQSISTTSGFAVFCILIATAYAGIWYLFLYESPPKRKISRADQNEEQAEEGAKAESQKPRTAQKQRSAQKQPA